MSSIGDEVNKVATAWLGASVWGAGAGYLAALYAGAAFIGSVFGGRWADRWSLLGTLLWSDVLRGLAVLMVPLAVWVGAPLLPVLLVVVVLTAVLGTFFDPALRASLPDVAPSPELLSTTTGLMETTPRLARVLGPGLIASIGGVVPMVHFFTLDAVTFLLSAISIVLVSARLAHRPEAPVGPVMPLGHTWQLLRRDAETKWMVMTSAPASATWVLVLPTGLALLVQHRFATDVQALGALIAAYGVGNITSNVLVASMRITRPAKLILIGRTVCGFGFIGVALSPTLPLMMAFAAIAASGGPLTDIGFLGLLQTRFAPVDVARLWRLILAVSWGGTLVVMACSPALFEWFGVPWLVGLSGAVLAVTGMAGFVRSRV